MLGTLRDFTDHFGRWLEDFHTDNEASFKEFRRGPCLYFHITTLQYVRAHPAPFREWLPGDRRCHELLYGLLTAWGMNRAGDKGPKLKDFEEFSRSLAYLASLEALESCRTKQIETLVPNDRALVEELFWVMRDSGPADIMVSHPSTVASSKLLHHLLPDLIPPIDRNYTEYALKHFQDGHRLKGSLEEFDNVWKILGFFNATADAVGAERIRNQWIGGQGEKFLMNTSVPKVIDNALVAYANQLG